jgi:glycosyltransferase involved in cell wall biosynthesis
MMLDKINLKDIDLNSFEIILDKAGRVVDGINHGRMVLKGDGVYYKIFDKDYCRRENFVKALEAGFFGEVAPALQSLIVDGEDIVGYITEAGEPIGSELDKVPDEFYQKILSLVNEKKMFFYDLVSLNIIRTKSGELSLIDLESVYDIEELYTIDKHNAKVKPDYYYIELQRLWRESMKKISFIQPSRNNLKYLKWSYESIRKNLDEGHEICWADDFSDDGTWEWMQEIAKKDPNVKIHRNEGPTRLGHTILYDTLVDMATNDIIMIYHADMYACPYMDLEVLRKLTRGSVVSATRIEPPLHPDGPEKILRDFGIEPEEFNEKELLEFVEGDLEHSAEKYTRGIFAPWAMYKDDFLAIGGHDPLYAPQSKEDSDIFNRFVLAGYRTIQTWQGFVYHMTCRGSRFKDGAMRNPAGQVFMKNRESSEWLAQNLKSTRNFIRKWGHMVKHDSYLKPIIPPKYDIGFVVEHCDSNMLKELEPWCSDMYGDWVGHKGFGVNQYIEEEQPNTKFKLSNKLHSHHTKPTNDIVVSFDAQKLTPQNFQVIVNMSELITDSGEVGEMEYDIFKFKINSIKTYEKELIICES